jgi:alkaline phosphatase D
MSLRVARRLRNRRGRTASTPNHPVSITSLSLAQSRIDAALPFNPHIHFGRADQRGYMSFELDAKQLRVRLRSVDRPVDPASGITTVARFVVDPGRPGPVAA